MQDQTGKKKKNTKKNEKKGDITVGRNECWKISRIMAFVIVMRKSMLLATV